mmetsp:Transcript_9243/g.11246  ORF Transcript_9243/g.11246 Transcript_9243/m.11246 type:complete len:160 (-) Transcript_9243:262-741(-)|eukprot:CAMPEP_0170464480 /NCGR_PEP_ID=MMETSP0123-20130129/9193_1 /TAXON_ID=182087 /ORGANISM="Favella ehrenbergii, Strain Fehren 1" /LENGTH=159 /DNA_ID=CAMNT_0010730157 /DNA_START=57 /DNA_END=536 /DNA_ORIENTATION=+
MKLSFFAAALLGLTANAVLIENNTDDFDYAQLETETHGKGEGKALADADADAEALTEADCEQVVNGMVVRLNIPECQPKPNPDQLIMQAVGELGGKATELNEALRLAFARNARLAATRTMAVTGSISLTPKIEEPKPAPKVSTVNISGGAGGCGCGTQL